MQCQEKETMFDFEKYSHYLLVEVKFNGAGTAIHNQVNTFVDAFKKENEGVPGFEGVELHTAISCASGKNGENLKEPFEFLMYFVDEWDNCIINGVNYSSSINAIKRYSDGEKDLSEAEKNAYSKHLEFATANIFAEIRSELGMGDMEMSNIKLRYHTYNENKEPEMDIIVDFRDKAVYRKFFNALKSKGYLSICYPKKVSMKTLPL
ncbi:MAG: hypothetical protein KAS11_02325 [Candidatus Aenigmarchaeota archaeon]|nr:hypothetical protein [Candidatus Aenigmarchaeota archaeon]